MEKPIEEKKSYRVSSGHATFILVVLTLLYLMNYADRNILAAVLQQMKEELGLSDTQLGIIQSVFMLGVGIMTMPLSLVIDRWSRRKSLGSMALVWSIATFATGLASNFINLIMARAVVGVGEASFVTGGVGWLSVVYPKDRRSRILGIFGIGSVLGGAIGLIFGGIIATKTGNWRMPFFIFAAPGVVLGILCFYLKDYATVKANGEGTVNKQYIIDWIKIFKIKSFTFFTIGQCFWAFYYFTLFGWLPALLTRQYGISGAKSGSIVGLASLFGIAGAVLGGIAADSWHRHNKAGRAYMMLAAHVVNTLLLTVILVFFGLPLPAFTVLLILQSLVTGAMTPLIFSLASDIVPLTHRISGYGINAALTYFAGAAIGPWVVGAISDNLGGGANGLRMGFLYTLPALIVAVIAYYAVSRFYVGDTEKVMDEVYEE